MAKEMECFEYTPEEDAGPARQPYKPRTEDVVVKDIDACASFEAFAGANLTTQDYTKSHYIPSLGSSALTLAADTRETPAQTYERLTAELARFKSDIASAKTVEGDVDISSLLTEELAGLEASLEATSKDAKLAPFLKPSFPTLPADLSSLPGTGAQSGVLTKTLGEEMQKFRSTMEQKSPAEEKTAKGVTYEIMAPPVTSSPNVDLVALDKRLTALEGVVGGEESAAEGLGRQFPDLTSGVVYLRRQLKTLNEPGVLEPKLRRIDALMAELELLEQQKQTIPGAKNPEYEQKLNKMYECMGEWDAAARLLPGVLARLQSIKDVSTEGADASSQIKKINDDQAGIDALLASQKIQLQQTKDSLSKGLAEMEATMTQLDSAMAKLL